MSAEQIPAFVREWMQQRVTWHPAHGRPRTGIVTDVFQTLTEPETPGGDRHQVRYARVLWDDIGRLDVIELELLSK